jgi:amino acid transporter
MHITPTVERRSLRRALGFWQVSLSGVGVILGAGVYALIGPAAGRAGHALWLSFVLAAITAALTAYSYARLGAIRPKASAEFHYTALAFGPTIGFAAGWLMLVADVAASATVALGFGGYAKHLIGTPTTANALALLVLMGIALYVGIAESVGLAVALTIVEAAGLLFVIAIGIPAWGRADYTTTPSGLTGIVGAAALIFFAYLGFDELGNFAEEMRNPERDLPRALFVALAATTLIYIAVALSATAVVPPATLARSTAPLALVARDALGSWADTMLACMALAATANTVLLLLLSASRSVYGMASAGVLPSRLSALGRTDVPTVATALVVVVVAVLVVVSELGEAAGLTDAAVLISFMSVNVSLAWLGAKGTTGRSELRRVVDVLIGSAAFLCCAALFVYTGRPALAAVGVAFVIGVLISPLTWNAVRERVVRR